MSKIFISYRRDDSGGYAGRLQESLAQEFGEDRVFMDLTDIGGGEDFAAVIRANLENTSVALILIGKQWADICDSQGHLRLHRADDTVAMEVASALDQVPVVIPVLVGGAVMPQASQLPKRLAGLSARNAVELSPKRWDYDVRRLMGAIGRSQDSLARAPRQLALSLLAVVLSTIIGLGLWTVDFLSLIPGYDWIRETAAERIEQMGPTTESEHVALIVEEHEGPEDGERRRWLRWSMATLLEGLSQAGAKVVVFDFFLEDNTDADARLARAIADLEGRGTEAVFGVRRFNPDSTPDLAFQLRDVLKENLGLVRPRVRRRSATRLQIEIAQYGPLGKSQSGEPVRVVPSLALRALMNYRGARSASYFPSESRIGVMDEKGERRDSIPVTEDLRMEISLQAMRHDSSGYRDILGKTEAGDQEFLRRRFKDRVVLVGSTAEGRLPDWSDSFGFQVQAQLIANLLRGGYWSHPSFFSQLCSFLLFSTIGVLWWHRFAPRGIEWEYSKARRRAIIRALVSLVLGLLSLTIICRVVSVVLFKNAALVLPFLYYETAFLTGFAVRMTTARLAR